LLGTLAQGRGRMLSLMPSPCISVAYPDRILASLEVRLRKWFATALVGHSSFVSLGRCLSSRARCAEVRCLRVSRENGKIPHLVRSSLFSISGCLCDLLASATFNLIQGTVTIYCPYVQIKLATQFYAYAPNGFSRSFGSILPLPK
jgi:hypothetical protein